MNAFHIYQDHPSHPRSRRENRCGGSVERFPDEHSLPPVGSPGNDRDAPGRRRSSIFEYRARAERSRGGIRQESGGPVGSIHVYPVRAGRKGISAAMDEGDVLPIVLDNERDRGNLGHVHVRENCDAQEADRKADDSDENECTDQFRDRRIAARCIPHRATVWRATLRLTRV